jgi:hypothetical protein
MARPPAPRQPLLAQMPAPARRAAGVVLLSLTLWMASILALFN